MPKVGGSGRGRVAAAQVVVACRQSFAARRHELSSPDRLQARQGRPCHGQSSAGDGVAVAAQPPGLPFPPPAATKKKT